MSEYTLGKDSPGFVVQAALHEVQGSLRQTRVAASKLDLPFPDVSVVIPAVLRMKRAVSTQPNVGKDKDDSNSYYNRSQSVASSHHDVYKPTFIRTEQPCYVWDCSQMMRCNPSLNKPLCLHDERQNSNSPDVSLWPNTLTFEDFRSFRKDNIHWENRQTEYLYREWHIYRQCIFLYQEKGSDQKEMDKRIRIDLGLLDYGS